MNEQWRTRSTIEPSNAAVDRASAGCASPFKITLEEIIAAMKADVTNEVIHVGGDGFVY